MFLCIFEKNKRMQRLYSQFYEKYAQVQIHLILKKIYF